MQKVTMFVMASCPHCHRAFAWMEQAKAANPAFGSVDVTVIDETEQPDLANSYDYYYVPTYYVGEEKVHEGVASLDIIKGVYERAMKG